MKKTKNNEVLKYILENYDSQNASDIADALNDPFLEIEALNFIHKL